MNELRWPANLCDSDRILMGSKLSGDLFCFGHSKRDHGEQNAIQIVFTINTCQARKLSRR